MERIELFDKRKSYQTYEHMFTFELLFSFTVCVLLWNLTLLINIRFGDKMVTHLSVLPYIVSAILCLVMLFEFLALAQIANIHYHDRLLYIFLKAYYSAYAEIDQIFTPIAILKNTLV